MTEKKFAVSALSMILAFTLQLIASVWFLSGLSGAIRVNSETITRISEEQRARSKKVYYMDVLSTKIEKIEQDIKDIKFDVRAIKNN